MAKILLVDDEDSVLKTIGMLFRSEGHEVTPIREGAKAAELVKSPEKFDLLITDIRMAPVDGMQLIKLARQATGHEHHRYLGAVLREYGASGPGSGLHGVCEEAVQDRGSPPGGPERAGQKLIRSPLFCPIAAITSRRFSFSLNRIP